jgi:hypothetical protein
LLLTAKGVVVTFNGRPTMGEINDPHFAEVMLGTFIGSEPPTPRLKRGRPQRLKHLCRRTRPTISGGSDGKRADRLYRVGTYAAAAISRVALIGSFSVLHNAVRFTSRGLVRPISQKYTQGPLTPTCSATSTTDRPRLIRALRR